MTMTTLYWIIFIGIAIASWAVSASLESKFKKYAKVKLDMTGREVALKMLHDNGIYDVEVTCIKGQLTDHYNPATKTVNLSEGVYNNANVAAAAVTNAVMPCNMRWRTGRSRCARHWFRWCRSAITG